MTDDVLLHILHTCPTIAVVGLSPKPDRPSYSTSQYMQRKGYRIVPVNPAQTEILGQRCYARLQDIPFSVHMVNIFRREDEVLPVAQEALAMGALCLWQQLGIAHSPADALMRAAGRFSVMDRCLKIEHQRLMRGQVLPGMR